MEENLDKEVKKVLVVDDEQAIIDVLVYNLKKEGYENVAQHGTTFNPNSLEIIDLENPSQVFIYYTNNIDVKHQGMIYWTVRQKRPGDDAVNLAQIIKEKENQNKESENNATQRSEQNEDIAASVSNAAAIAALLWIIANDSSALGASDDWLVPVLIEKMLGAY